MNTQKPKYLFRRRKEDRPGELVDAALDVFVEKGLQPRDWTM
ncbi:MAG TPA: hypothetical protein VMC81_11685 [Rhodocyclaceae bacterium]|nr:hypothetical protein [Rhodocyclaceae bacterium]